jgi:hypothetical protein
MMNTDNEYVDKNKNNGNEVRFNYLRLIPLHTPVRGRSRGGA